MSEALNITRLEDLGKRVERLVGEGRAVTAAVALNSAINKYPNQKEILAPLSALVGTALHRTSLKVPDDPCSSLMRTYLKRMAEYYLQQTPWGNETDINPS